MVPILLAVLPAILTPLIKVAEKKIGAGDGEAKKSWVLEMLNDLWEIAAQRIPFMNHFEKSKDAALELAAGLIDKKVEKLKAKGKL